VPNQNVVQYGQHFASVPANNLALPAIWGIGIRQARIYGGMWGIIGDYRATRKKPVIFGKKIQNKNGYPFFVLFLVINIGFLVAQKAGRQANSP